MSEKFEAFRVDRVEGRFVGAKKTISVDDLPPGDVLIDVAYSALNYKDALSASGNPGVSKRFPHTPGIDAAGIVAHSDDSRFTRGQKVVVTGYDLGMNTPGGFQGMIRIPADWIVPLPDGLTLRESMILGTGGLTAGLCVEALLSRAIVPGSGPVLVTGASGGVGSLAVAMLTMLGFEVEAGTGSAAAHRFLEELGAATVLDRSELSGSTDRPMLSKRWASVVDGVGGTTLENAVKSLKPYGVVAVYGLVGGPGFSLTVFPFILRGVSMVGIESAECPMDVRKRIWSNMAGPWKPDKLDKIAVEIGLDGLDKAIDDILRGRTRGRVVVRL